MSIERVLHEGRFLRSLMFEGITGVMEGRFTPAAGMACGLMGASAARTLTHELRVALEGPRLRAPVNLSLPEPEAEAA